MESLQTIKKLKIETNKIFYDKKTEILSIYIFDFIFIGNYKKTTKISKILDDIYKSLGDTQLNREDVSFVDFVTFTTISEKTKLKNLNLISKKEKEKKKKEKKEEAVKKDDISVKYLKSLDEKELGRDVAKQFQVEEKKERSTIAPKAKKKSRAKEAEPVMYKFAEEAEEEDVILEEPQTFDDDASSELEMIKSAPPPPPLPKLSRASSSAPPGAGAPIPVSAPKDLRDELGGLGEAPDSESLAPSRRLDIAPAEPKTTVYEINMGLQYYSVMMEKTSYLFYVYFSHKELKIIDEEGKTVFETSFRIETTKKEPPIVDLKVEGEGFEVHPLHGKVEIKKKAINPPVMIFSVLPTKKKNRTKKDKKESERRYLHVYIEYEKETINHSVLSIIVQPKHFHLDIGPIHLDISKKAAMIVSLFSVIISLGSLIYTIFSIDPSSTLVDIMGNFAPGLGSIIFIGIFLFTLFKEGLYPLKEKVSYFLNFDKTGMLIK
jgi:hypothetical protein